MWEAGESAGKVISCEDIKKCVTTEKYLVWPNLSFFIGYDGMEEVRELPYYTA